LTVSDSARALGVSRKTLSGIVNGRVGISPEMAVRFSLAFDTAAENWLSQQVQYDLWRAEKKRYATGQRLSAARAVREDLASCLLMSHSAKTGAVYYKSSTSPYTRNLCENYTSTSARDRRILAPADCRRVAATL